jgi:hypothetical protein
MRLIARPDDGALAKSEASTLRTTIMEQPEKNWGTLVIPAETEGVDTTLIFSAPGRLRLPLQRGKRRRWLAMMGRCLVG